MLNIFKKKAPAAKKQYKNFNYPAKNKSYYHPGGTVSDPLIKDIIKAPHTLIAGTTGSGKSVLLNSIIYNIINSCDINTKLLLIDPKRIELSKYRKLPQVIQYANEAADSLEVLDFVINNIEYRYKLMEELNIEEYNGSTFYLIIDELADLMISPQSKEIKLKLQKILQIARAAKIHVIACTQAPNRKIIDSSIVLNFTNRVALRCLSAIESRQIINVSGAELLPQYGKCLYLSPQGLKRMTIEKIDKSLIDNTIYRWLHELEAK